MQRMTGVGSTWTNGVASAASWICRWESLKRVHAGGEEVFIRQNTMDAELSAGQSRDQQGWHRESYAVVLLRSVRVAAESMKAAILVISSAFVLVLSPQVDAAPR